MPDFGLLAGTPNDVANTPGSSAGISCTSGAANTKGSWVQLLAATSAPVTWVIATFGFSSLNRYLVDIGIGASTAERVLIPNLFGEAVGVLTQLQARVYVMPLFIPAGARLSIRCQCVAASQVASGFLNLIHGQMPFPNPLGMVEACGANASGATAIASIDPGATINTDGAVTQLIASTAFPYKWVCIGFGHSSNTTAAGQNLLFDIMIGAAGVEKVLISDLYLHNDVGIDTTQTTYCFPCSIPAGSRLSARARSDINTATTRLQDIVLYGVG
jgi:hypothetical protein